MLLHVDIARSPQDKPSQPYIKYLLIKLGRRSARLILAGTVSTTGLSTLYKTMLPIVIPVVYLPLILVALIQPLLMSVILTAGKKGAFVKHEKSYAHNNAMVAWKQYEEAQNNLSTLPHQLNNMRQVLIAENSHYLKTIAEILLLCAHPEIGLRGHNKSSSSSNRGNFLTILQFVGRHDE